MKRGAKNSTSIQARGAGANAVVRFGNVTVTVEKPSLAEIERSVKASTDALERVTQRLVHPGVRLEAKKDIPLFSVDPNCPGAFIREMNGKSERGVLENGEFKVIG